jgi:hypothetical protein
MFGRRMFGADHNLVVQGPGRALDLPLVPRQIGIEPVQEMQRRVEFCLAL